MADDFLLHERPGRPSNAGLFAPSPLYLTGEDHLRVTAYSNTATVTLAVTARILRADGTPVPIADTIAPASTRTATQKVIGLAEGWLLGVALTPAAGVTALGATWVQLDLVRGLTTGAQLVQTLGYGFVSTRSGFAWPGGREWLATEGPGVVRSVAGTTPPAGNDWLEAVPAGARWELIALIAQLTTSATVATRSVRLHLDDGAAALLNIGAPAGQAAGAAVFYSYGGGAGGPMIADPSFIYAPLPNDLYLGAGFRLISSTGNLQAGDQWGGIQLLVREWIEGA